MWTPFRLVEPRVRRGLNIFFCLKKKERVSKQIKAQVNPHLLFSWFYYYGEQNSFVLNFFVCFILIMVNNLFFKYLLCVLLKWLFEIGPLILRSHFESNLRYRLMMFLLSW